jgi:hypothetical protein
MEANSIDNAICLNVKTGIYKRVRTMISGPEGTTIMFQDGSVTSFSEFSQDWIVDSEMTDEEFKEVSQMNVFNIAQNQIQTEESDKDILTKPIKSKKTNNSIIENQKNDNSIIENQKNDNSIIENQKNDNSIINNTILDLFSRLPDDVQILSDDFKMNNFPVDFIRDFIKYFNINRGELADGLLNKYKEQFKDIIIKYVCKEDQD